MEKLYPLNSVIGYRQWTSKLYNNGINLSPTLISHGGTMWPKFQKLEAVPDGVYSSIEAFQNRNSQRGIAPYIEHSPSIGGTDGIYARKDSNEVVRHNGFGNVMGEVSLWGIVLDCEYGYRAQYAYPASFLDINSQETSLDLPFNNDELHIIRNYNLIEKQNLGTYGLNLPVFFREYLSTEEVQELGKEYGVPVYGITHLKEKLSSNEISYIKEKVKVINKLLDNKNSILVYEDISRGGLSILFDGYEYFMDVGLTVAANPSGAFNYVNWLSEQIIKGEANHGRRKATKNSNYKPLSRAGAEQDTSNSTGKNPNPSTGTNSSTSSSSGMSFSSFLKNTKKCKCKVDFQAKYEAATGEYVCTTCSRPI